MFGRFGSHIDDSMVTGIDGGYTVQSTGGEEQMPEDLSDMRIWLDGRL